MSAYDPLKLGRDLFAINSDAVQRLAQLQTEHFAKYVEESQKFGENLTQLSDITGLFDLQRAYGESMYNTVTAGFQAQSEVVQDSVARTGEAVREAISTAVDAVRA